MVLLHAVFNELEVLALCSVISVLDTMTPPGKRSQAIGRSFKLVRFRNTFDSSAADYHLQARVKLCNR